MYFNIIMYSNLHSRKCKHLHIYIFLYATKKTNWGSRRPLSFVSASKPPSATGLLRVLEKRNQSNRSAITSAICVCADIRNIRPKPSVGLMFANHGPCRNAGFPRSPPSIQSSKPRMEADGITRRHWVYSPGCNSTAGPDLLATQPMRRPLLPRGRGAGRNGVARRWVPSPAHPRGLAVCRLGPAASFREASPLTAHRRPGKLRDGGLLLTDPPVVLPGHRDLQSLMAAVATPHSTLRVVATSNGAKAYIVRLTLMFHQSTAHFFSRCSEQSSMCTTRVRPMLFMSFIIVSQPKIATH